MSYKLEDLKNGAIIFSCPNPIHNNYGIQIFDKNRSRIDKFNKDMRHWLSNNPHIQWFHQGSEDDWSYFEIWNGHIYQDSILEFAELLSDRNKLKLLID